MKCDKCGGSMMAEKGGPGQPDELRCIGCGKRVMPNKTEEEPMASMTDKEKILRLVEKKQVVNRSVVQQHYGMKMDAVKVAIGELVAEKKVSTWDTRAGGMLITAPGAEDPRYEKPNPKIVEGRERKKAERVAASFARNPASEIPSSVEGKSEPLPAPCTKPETNGGGRTRATESPIPPPPEGDPLAVALIELRWRRSQIDSAIAGLEGVM